jgi:hypothetical protein
MHKKIVQAAVGLGLVFALGTSHAQLGGLGTLTGAKSGGSGSSVTAESLVKSYVGGARHVMNADASLLRAVGLKDSADRSALAAKNLTEGATSSSLEEAEKVQTESSKLLAEKLNDRSTVISEEGKKEYSKGLASLARGIVNYTAMSSDVKNYRPSLTSMNATSESAAYVVRTLPSSVSNLTSTLKKAVEFAREKKIEVPKEATSLL